MIRTLLPMAADGIGPAYTCVRLTDGMARAGADIELMVNRQRGEQTAARLRSALPGPLSYLPHRTFAPMISERLEHWYLRRIDRDRRDGDIAWLWPSVSLETHRQVAARGLPIVLEGINTRMAHAKAILDAAYDRFGAPPGHGITEARIAEEEEKLALATTIFAPSPSVEVALAGSPLEGRFLRSSYGVDLSRIAPPSPGGGARDDGRVTFLFVGYACVRKGIHHLLDLWPRLPATAHLKIVGRIEPVIAERYRDLLASDRVTAAGFTRDVLPHYRDADVFVFPSLEEGDPLVTYEAAAHGLPLVTTTPGAGRMGATPGVDIRIDPEGDPDGFEAAMVGMWRNAEHRAEAGATARKAAAQHDWLAVGAERAAILRDLAPAATSAATASAAPASPAPAAPLHAATPGTAAAREADAGLVSVVMPTYNRSTSVKTAIHSVLRQSWSDLELIIVDDGSEDDTTDVVRSVEDPRIRLICMEQNSGPSAARNRGIAEARGRWVAFQDSDDEWLPDKLTQQMARIRAFEAEGRNVVAAYCGMAVEGSINPRPDARLTLRYVPPSEVDRVEGDLADTLCEMSIISTQMLMARRDVLDAIGGFDEELKALVDWDLSIRLAEEGFIAFVDRILVIQRFSENSITRNRRRRIAARERIIDKHLDRLRGVPAILSQQYQVLAGEYRLEGMLDEASAALRQARRYTRLSPRLWLRSLRVWLQRQGR